MAEACNSGEGIAMSGGRSLVGSTSTSLAGAERMRDALNEYFGNMIDMLSGHGRAVQVDPIKPALKPNRLELSA